MTIEEQKAFRQHCLASWERVKDASSWQRGPRATWKPVMTERQQREHQQYVIENKLPF